MLLAILVFFLVLSVLVFIHELGHFLAAKKAGIKVEEFGFGLPPRIFGIQKGETLYSLNWLPIGGFVKLYGEEEEVNWQGSGYWQQKNIPFPERRGAGVRSADEERAFFQKSKLTRAVVLLAGVTMNFLLAVIIISYFFTRGVMVPTDKVIVKEVAQNSPAEKAGIKVGDTILKLNNQPIKSPDELTSKTKKYLGQKITLEISRSSRIFPISLIPRQNPPKNEGAMGVAISNLELHQYPLWKAPFAGLAEAFQISGLMITELGKVLWQLITLHPVGKEVAGPIGIAQATGEAVKFGPEAVLQLMGLLSLNLAVVNILPFPALDGGRLLFVVIEGVVGKKVKPAFERMAHQIGMLILLSLIALVTINDVLRLFNK